MAECVVPGCAREAENQLSLRLRRKDTSAIWAPNLEAFVCDTHATSGARVHILFEPAETGEIETHVLGANADHVRRTEIRQPAKQLADDLADAARSVGSLERAE